MGTKYIAERPGRHVLSGRSLMLPEASPVKDDTGRREAFRPRAIRPASHRRKLTPQSVLKYASSDRMRWSEAATRVSR